MSKNFDPNQNHYFFNNKGSITLVFIHGVGLDHQMWHEQVNYLNEFSIEIPILETKKTMRLGKILMLS